MKNTMDEVVFLLGCIQGELVGIRKLTERVSQLEQWQAWLKGGWAVLAGAFAYCFRLVTGK
jgi:hypothetical protein